MNARRAPLGELCEMDRRGIPPDDPLAVELPFIGVENVVSGTGLLNFDTDSRVGAQKSTAFRFDPRHVLYGKLRPYLNKVAVPDFAGRCSTELVPLLPRTEWIETFSPICFAGRRPSNSSWRRSPAPGCPAPT